jgi:iron-sulfur cluster assembly accessory protein
MGVAEPVVIPPSVSDRAFARLAEIGAPVLRVAVDGGGCSGFQYRFEIVPAPAGDDLVLAKDGVQVVVDPVSLPFLAGAVIDFTEELIGARFAVQNPNATSSCGCGNSFAV